MQGEMVTVDGANMLTSSPSKEMGSESALRVDQLNFSSLQGSGKCLIPLTEQRGITGEQLHLILEFLVGFIGTGSDRLNLAGWRDLSHESQTFGQPLQLSSINLYQLNTWMICPATYPRKVSYVEFASDDVAAQWPKSFVSHAWVEPVADFIRCVDQHRATRGLALDVTYWVCAYCNNQHELETCLPADPRQTSFFKAMTLCYGVLVVLDEQGPATPFQRIWCCFEQATWNDSQQDKPLDICTVKDGIAHMLTRGLTEAEEAQEILHADRSWKASGWSLKSKREKGFPVGILRKGLEVNIETARASKDIDRIRILNTIAGAPEEDLNKTPTPSCPAYQRLGHTLGGIFALAAWRTAVETGIVLDVSGSFPLAQALSEDIERQEVKLSFNGCKDLDAGHLGILAHALPPHLKTLRLDLGACKKIESVDEFADGLSTLVELTDLQLNLSGCMQLANISSLSNGLRRLVSLSTLDLKLRFCTGLVDIGTLGHAFTNLPLLHSLVVDCNYCDCDIPNIEDFAEGLAGLGQLTSLEVGLDSCKGIESLSALFTSLASLPRLLHCTLCMGSCGGIFDESIDCLWHSLRSLPLLEKLVVTISNNDLITSIDGLSDPLQNLNSLKELTLDFSKCGTLVDVAPVGKAFSSLNYLTTLSVCLVECIKIQSIESLAAGLATMKSLQNLKLNLRGCPQITSVDWLANCFIGLPAIKKFSLNIRHCEGLYSIGNLGKILVVLKKLEDLEILMGESKSLSDFDSFCTYLSDLTDLEKLTLDCARCTWLQSLDFLGTSLACLISLNAVDLRASWCSALQKIGHFSQSLITLPKLISLSLDFMRCDLLPERIAQRFASVHDFKRALSHEGILSFDATEGLVA